MSAMYTDEHIEHWGAIFVACRAHARLHISFETFIAKPHQSLNRLSRFAAGSRTAQQQLIELQETLERAAMRAHQRGDVLIEKNPRKGLFRRPWFFSRRNHV